MTNRAEEAPKVEPLPLTESQLFLKRSVLGSPKIPPTHLSANQADDNTESESDGDDNDFDSPLQHFLQATASDHPGSSSQKNEMTTEGTLGSTAETKQYSLEPDMLFGWRPKYIPQVPVPLKFCSSMLEDIVAAFTESSGKQKYPDLVYQGFRPENTFYMHEKLSTNESYNSNLSTFAMAKNEVLLKTSLEGPINPPRPFLGMKKNVREDCLVFDSIFEHGNLDTVIRKAANEYDLFLRVDSNTKGHTNWYYFTVKNMRKGQKVKINIMNFSKATSLYQRGKKPYVHSKKLFENKKIDWSQTGEHITYGISHPSYFGESFHEPNHKKYYKLSFEYTFEYEDDVVSFALCVPYSYGRLIQFIQGLIEDQKASDEGMYLMTSRLCYSLGGISVPLLTITDPDESETPMSQRQYIVCTGRVHPGESNSSWMIQGFVRELCKDKPESVYLRKKYIWKIIPMLNPDGVIVGNHRTGMCGNDLNRQFVTPKDVLHPSLIALKDMVREIVTEKRGEVFAYIDFHGHSLKKNVFMYGAEFPVYDPNYYRVKILPKLLSKRNCMFRFQSCLFTVSKPKMTTARAVFSTQYGVAHFYTLEASYANYLNADRETIPFDANGFIEMGISITDAFFDYRKLLDEEEAALLNLKLKREESIRLNMLRLEGTRSELIRTEAEESVITPATATTFHGTTTTFNGIEKTPIRLRSGQDRPERVEDKISPRNITDSPTPKGVQDMRKNRKFRIRKGKTLETEGTFGFSGELSFESPTRAKAEVSAFKDKEPLKDEGKKNKPAIIFADEPKLGIFSLMDEIRKDIIYKDEAEKAESDDFSEGGSDSEGSEDDFNTDEMKKLQKNILNKAQKFYEICRNDEKYDPKKLKKSNTTFTSKSVIKEKPKVARTILSKQADLSPKEKKISEILKSVPRQSIMGLQSAADRSTSRTMAALKRGDGTLRPTMRTKISLAPRELIIDSDTPSNGVSLKNQGSSFYLGSMTGPKREGTVRNMLSAQSSRKVDILQGQRFIEETPKRNIETSPESRKILQESVKAIQISGQMSKQYQRLKTPLESLSQIKGSSTIANNGPDLEIAIGEIESFVSLHLDKGLKSTLALTKYRTPKGLQSTEPETFKDIGKEVASPTPSGYYKHRIYQQNPIIDIQEPEFSPPPGRCPSRGRPGMGGMSPHVAVATAQVYSSYKGEIGPIGMSPLKKDVKLPMSFESYKKMLHSRRKTEDIRGRRSTGIK